MDEKERISALLTCLNLNASKLARELGLSSPQVFYDIKAGKCGISKDLAQKIQAKFLSVNKSWLLTGEGNIFLDEQPYPPTPPSAPEETNRFIAIINRQLDVISKRDEQIDRLLDQTDRMLTLLEKK